MRSRHERRPLAPEPFRGSFVGRAADVAAVRALVARGERLVTLLGPGGVGKTRLAHRLLADLAEAFDASLFCDLSSARSGGDVVTMVASGVSGIALGAAATHDDASERVGRALARKGSTALVLDNLEQLEDAALAAISGWIAAAPRLVVIATSRVRLSIAGEVVHRVEPLGTSDALSLFEERARAVRGALAPEERLAAERIVALLEGLPLALEMAATRLVVLGPEELLERLSRPLAVLTSATRSDPERHASLSRVLDKSWELLGDADRAALAEIGVFVGGLTLDAAEAVLGAGAETLSLVQRLADSSLVRPISAPGRRTRHVPYEVVREYALERLAELGRTEATRWAHARHYATWADTRPTLADLVDEAPNLGAAVSFLRDAHGSEARVLRLRLLVALEPVRMVRGQLDAWAHDLEPALSAITGDERDAHSRLVARAGLGLARALHELGRTEPARAAYDDAIRSARLAADATLESFALSGLGRLVAGVGEWERACALFAEARSLAGCADAARKLAHACHEFYGTEIGAATDVVGGVASYVDVCRAEGDPRELAFWLTQLGRARSELTRERARAEADLEEALAIARRAGDLRGEGFASFALGTHHMAFGRLEDAVVVLNHAVRRLREAGTRRYEAWSLGFLGTTFALLGRWIDAKQSLDDALAFLREVADVPRETHLLAFRGAVLARMNERAQAERDLARASTIAPAKSRYHRWTIDLCRAQLAVVDGELASAKAVLDEAGYPRGTDVSAPREWPWGTEFFEPRIAAALLDGALREVEEPKGALVVADDGSFFVLPSGQRVVCPGRGKLQRIVLELARARARSDGTIVSAPALIEAGWRGERLRPSAGANRLHVALDQLRKLGLRDVLVRADGGWRFDSRVPFAWARHGAARLES